MGHVHIRRKRNSTHKKIFKNTNIKTAFRTRNTLKKHLLPNLNTTDMYDKPGVCKLKCTDRPLQYIGQTGHSLKLGLKNTHQRYKK
jgi:hypothetical protein